MSSLILLITSIISTQCFLVNAIFLRRAKDELYFQQELTNKNGKLTFHASAELQCNIMLSGKTNNDYPIQYYQITISQKIKQLYGAYFKISTCCFIDDNTKHATLLPTFDKAFDEYWSSQSISNDIIFRKQTEKQNALKLWCDYCDCENKQNNNSMNVTFDDIAYFYEGYSCDRPSFCNKNSSLDTILYILNEKKNIVQLLDVQDDSESTICDNTEKSVIDLMSYPSGNYIIAVGGFGNETGSFSLSLQCGNTLIVPPNTDTSSWSWITICVLFSVFILGCSTWYSYQLHCFRKTQIGLFNKFLIDYKLKKYAKELKKEIHWMIEVYHLDDCELREICKICLLTDTEENIFINACNDYKNGIYPLDTYENRCSKKPNYGTKYSEITGLISSDEQTDCSEDFKTDNEEMKTVTNIKTVPQEIKTKSNLMRKYNTTNKIYSTMRRIDSLISYHSIIRRIGVYETRANLRLKDGEDTIQRVIAHVISFCNDNDGLDIYQVMAVRCVDDISLQPTIFYPLKALGCGRCCKDRARRCKCMHISSYHSALFISFVVCLLQTFGFTITIYALIYKHLHPDYTIHNTCSMRSGYWNEPSILLYKILALLWSFYITFNIEKQMSQVKDDGLYKTFTVLEYNELDTITCVDFTIVRWGQLINYYTGAFAVCGCYFVIYATNSSEDPAIDMILNSLALFFMLEADNIVVDFKDYQDISRIFKQYGEQYEINPNFYKTEITKQDKRCYNIWCKKCCETCHSCPEIFGSTVTILLYVIGAFAPFAIFLCW